LRADFRLLLNVLLGRESVKHPPPLPSGAEGQREQQQQADKGAGARAAEGKAE